MYQIHNVHGPIFQTETNANDFSYWRQGLIDWIEAIAPLAMTPGVVLVVAQEGWQNLQEAEREAIVCRVKAIDTTHSRVIDRDEKGAPLTIEAHFRVAELVHLSGGRVIDTE